MKKKLYIQPSLDIVKVKVGTLMQASAPGYDPDKNFSDENAEGSRGAFGLWEPDDEFDEEEFE